MFRFDPALSGTFTAASVARSRRGFALEATLVVMVLVGAIVALTTAWVLTTQRTTGIDYRGARVQHAAEAGADAIMAQLEVAMHDGVLRQAEIDALVTPTLAGFEYENLEVTYAGAAEVRKIQSGAFTGLYALNQPVEIAVTARDPNGNRASVVVTVNAQSIPLFQFGVFYEDDLEIHPGAVMDFEGWVHTNGNLYLSSGSQLQFRSLITTPKKLFNRRKNNYNTGDDGRGVRIAKANGTLVALNFDSNNPADHATFRARSQSDFDSRVMTEAHSVSELRLPLPLGVPPIELIQPRHPSDDPETKDVKFAYKADWHITVDASIAGTNICSSLRSGTYQWERKGGKTTPGSTDCANIFSWKREAFFDRREATKVDVFEIDMDRLRSWVGSNTARQADIMYITFVNVGSRYPAVRIRNASRLPNPMTIATDRPMYVWGNFNSYSTASWEPASLLADAITFLSPSWQDAQNTSQGSSVRAGSDMTVYAAVAAGHSATACDRHAAGCSVITPPPSVSSTDNYGGGLENFPRFLENGSRTLTYRGSLVSLFQSQYANQRRWEWTTGIYAAPQRDWKFDLRFNDPSNLPPGTPTVGSVLQTAFRPVF
jgi:hypothetical protein